jgi:hypothetical protein
MDRLWVLKKEFDPFGWVIPGIGAIGILPIFRCTFYRCPYCRWPFRIAWGSSNSLLGAGERSCWHCKQVFWDGSNEWPEMGSEDRRLFLLPITIAGYIAAVLVISGLYGYLLMLSKNSANRAELLFLIVLALPIALWFCFRWVQVIRSVHRYNSRRNSPAA